MKQVIVNRATCIGCQMCIQIASGTFSMDEEGLSVAHNPAPDSEELVQQAIDACPVQAIIWDEN